MSDTISVHPDYLRQLLRVADLLRADERAQTSALDGMLYITEVTFALSGAGNGEPAAHIRFEPELDELCVYIDPKEWNR